ncbi:MAG TPA: tetratricopeptide repeat protein [Trichormus sp.]|jgi:tetratricopeptide (TPR) repeat protein
MKCDTIPDLEKFLAIQEQALGPTTSEVAATVARLAELYFERGNLERAEALFQRSFDIRAGLRGFHREGIEAVESRLEIIKQQRRQKAAAAVVASSTDNFAVSQPVKPPSLSSQSQTGEHARAQVHCGEHRTIDAQPDDHHFSRTNAQPADTHESPAATGKSSMPPTANSGMRVSGNTYKNIQNAIGEMEIEVELLRQMMGEDHPAVADMLTRLADLHCRLRMYDKMEVLLVEALRIRETACGTEHISVALELKNLAALYCVQERYALAEPLLKRAIMLRERAFGKIHPKVADVEEQYAQLLRKTNRAAQAEALEQHINEIRTAQDSPRFPRDSSFFGAA